MMRFALALTGAAIFGALVGAAIFGALVGIAVAAAHERLLGNPWYR